MGGHVTAVAIEQYPRAYDGALPMCGVMGDVALFDYFIDFNLAAQALVGVDATFPNPDFDTTVLPDLIPALGPAYPTLLNDTGEQLKTVTRNLSGGNRPLFDTAFVVWDQFLFQYGGTDGTVNGVARGNVVDNTDRIYRIEDGGALTPEEVALNDAILRIQADPQARRRNGIDNIPPVRGEATIPVLSMHTLGDLFVPFSMQQIYAERMGANGLSHLLVQRAIRDVGHCAFSPQEQARAFQDLVDWVETGMRPDGDVVTDPATVADPDYGCTFTDPQRPGLPACS